MSEALPVLTRAIDNTALSAYMACPREYQLAMIRGYKPKKQKSALAYGAYWHKLLEVHYKTGGDSNAILNAIEKYAKTVAATDYRTAERAFLDYKNYVKKFPVALDCSQTMGFPHAPLVELSTAIHSDIMDHDYAVKIDRGIVVDKLGYVEDHKTTSRLDKHYFSQYANSNQMKGYVWGLQQLVPDIKIVGVRINLAHVLTAKTEFERHTVTYGESIMKEWEQNAALWIRQIKNAIATDTFPAHFGDNGCSRKFGQCDFFQVCGSSLMIRESVLNQEYEIRPWDPMRDEDTPE